VGEVDPGGADISSEILNEELLVITVFITIIIGKIIKKDKNGI
jgi:hypothetical protein